MVQLPDPNKSFLLFTDASKFCYLGALTQASTKEFCETPLKILTSKTLITSVESQSKTSNFHPVSSILLYTYQVASVRASVGSLQSQKNALVYSCQ